MNLFKVVKTPTLIACISSAVVGLLLLIWPVFILKFICILMALALLAVGCLRIMTYFKENKKAGLPPLNFAIGLFCIIAGIALIAESSQVIFIFPFALCLAVCFATCMMVQRTYDLFKSHVADWWIVGILALISLILSIVLLSTLQGAMLSLGLNHSLLLTGLSLIYAAAAVITMEVFIDMRTSKKSSVVPAAKTVASADSLDDLK